MKWLLIAAPILVGLAAAIATVGLGGLLLPVKHTASRAARFAAPPQTIWAIMTDFPNHPSWRPGLKTIARDPDISGHQVWRETDKHGNSIPMEMVTLDPPRRLVSRIADPKLPFGGTWAIDLTPSGEGTQVRITEDGEVYNPAFRYVSRIIGYTGTMESYLRGLGTKLGETAEIQP